VNPAELNILNRREPRVLHIITGLNQGGAEQQLLTLLRSDKTQSAVFSIKSPGSISAQIQDIGIPVFTGDASNILSSFWIRRLRETIKSYKPDIVQGWMYHGNLATVFARYTGFKGRVFWNIRHSISDLSLEALTTTLLVRAGAKLSGKAERIIYNSATSARQHEAIGYRAERTTTIPNGFDVDRFQPDDNLRRSQRAALELSEDQWLIGVIGRAHPMKNHHVWLDAFSGINEKIASVHTLIVGRGVPDALSDKVDRLRAKEHVHLMENVARPEEIYPALDLLVLPSKWGEGFSNVVGEAMACGVPALVTDVGDNARVVQESGFVVSESEALDLETAVTQTLSLGKEKLKKRGKLSRARIVEKYSISSMVRNYQALWDKI
jgi:glycosyltransferase involved in cell wall biosynthesis